MGWFSRKVDAVAVTLIDVHWCRCERVAWDDPRFRRMLGGEG